MFLILSSKDVVWAPRVVALIRSPGGTSVHLKDRGVLESHLSPASILRRSTELGLVVEGLEEAPKGASDKKKERER
ncbi:hypothetical protein TheveDRAFT_1737 [Thermanaerovibrio velox DSM 12556]|uniref:Uncharacterized protein n=1 Tax=Thermanaerovibrio velox DSM 12556 TaxID=926567 RepID=H0UR18_9BACT|nr:hypothetical protein [Thermanaerovibrio velox]EHM10855.1 hypothetical protein TheveDRAFT_1737 [Thermanaerovibrio velox DSM 12556]